MVHLIALGTYVQTHALAIVVAIVLSIAIGFLWHGPLFGKQWMKYNKVTPPKKGEMKFSMMVPGLIAAIVMVFVQATVIGRTFELVSLANVWEALLIAGILWLPFTGLVIVNGYTWEGKPAGHMALDAGYNLANMLAVAVVLYAMM